MTNIQWRILLLTAKLVLIVCRHLQIPIGLAEYEELDNLIAGRKL